MIDGLNLRSPLAPYMTGLLRIKESCGFRVLSTKWTFKEFDAFSCEWGLSEPMLSKELAEAYIASRCNDCARTKYGKCSRLAQLGRYMNEQGVPSYIMPLPNNVNDRAYVPYIFSEDQLDAIFKEADKLLRESHRKDDPIISIPVLLRFLFSTGLRISEAVSLRNQDVDLEGSYVQVGTWVDTKNREERLVPVSPSLKECLIQYLRHRNKLKASGTSEPDSPFFVKINGQPLSVANAYRWFKKVYTRCGIAYMGSGFGPRVHDLRHCMATYSLSKMIKEGLDVYTALPLLGACLGHKSIRSTEGYVRLTCAQFPELIEISANLNKFLYEDEER